MKPGKPCPRTGKRSFSSHSQAIKHGVGLLFSPARVPEIRAYVCPFCHRWHITTHPHQKPVDTTTRMDKK